MQTVSSGDSLHEISNPIYGENKENIIGLLSAESAHSMVSVKYRLCCASLSCVMLTQLLLLTVLVLKFKQTILLPPDMPRGGGGGSGGAKVLCILHHRGVQLILAYSWARPAILVVGKGRGGMFLFLLLLHFHSCSSFFPVPLFHLLYSLFCLFSPFLWETTQNDPQGLTCR